MANAELDVLTARNSVLVAEQTLRNAMGLREPLDFDPADVLEAPPLAITEEHAGSDVSSLEATVRRDGGDYVLDGVKWHVTSYNSASFCFFQGVLTDGPHAGEHALVVVDLPSEGVRVVRTPAYSHTTSHHHPIVAFENVRVPATHLVGAEGEGMRFSHDWFRFERLMVAARCLGAAERLVDEARDFALTRRVGGRPTPSR